MKILICWQKNLDLNAYSIPVRVSNPSLNLNCIVYAIFDTRFTGMHDLDEDTIKNLQLNKIGSQNIYQKHKIE